MSRMFRKVILGETVVREFSTVGINDVVGEKVYLQAGDLLIDVTENQWMLGLEPLTFGIWVESNEYKEALGQNTDYTIYFRRTAPEHPRHAGRNALALARLNFFDRIDDEKGTLFLLQVKSSRIFHINSLKARLIYRKFYKKPEVSFEKLKAVATAYSYPRRVRVISFKQGNDYNYIFPMDLLGDIRQSGRYLLGMRHSNQVLTKIMDVKKIVVSEAPASYKQVIYQLGRNHSAAPPSLDQLPFPVITTRQFGFPAPDWVESYKEVTIHKTVDLGSHMLLYGEWTEDAVLKSPTPRLHHIHFLHFLNQKSRKGAYPIV